MVNLLRMSNWKKSWISTGQNLHIFVIKERQQNAVSHCSKCFLKNNSRKLLVQNCFFSSFYDSATLACKDFVSYENYYYGILYN